MAAVAVLILVGIWTMIQSIGYGAMAFMGLLTHNCQMTMNGSRLIHFWYTVYFRDNECGPVNWTLLFGQNVPITPELPEVTHVADRTNTLLLVYFLLSILWLATSLMVLVGTCISCMGTCGYYLMFHPWIYVTLANIALDVVASGYFIWDLVQFLSWSGFLSHLEVGNANQFPTFPDEHYLSIPAIIMLVIAARGLLFWILNIALIPAVVSSSRTVVFGNISAKRASIQLHPTAPLEPSNPHNNNNIGYMFGAGVTGNGHPSEPTIHVSQNTRTNIESNRYSDPVAHQHNIPDYNRPPPAVYPSGRRRLEPLKGRESPVRNDDDSFNERLSSDRVMDNTINSKMEMNYRYNQSRPSVEKNPHLSQYDDKRLSIDRPHLITSKPSSKVNGEKPIVPAKPRMDARHSNNPPAELRGQLPWSYFSSRDDVSGPKKTFTQLREGEDAPPVPVPDYTLHFPKKERPRTSSVTTDDGKWNGPEARY